MTALQIIFLISAAVILVSAVMVVTTRNMVHAALWLDCGPFRRGGYFCGSRSRLSCSCSGGDLYRCDRHHVHLCSDAHQPGNAR